MGRKNWGKLKHKGVLTSMVVISAMGFGACTARELKLVTEQVEVELGTQPDTTITNYVQLDERKALDAVLDFSAVDINQVGKYLAVITYRKQSVEIPIIVKDTKAPIIKVKNMVVPVGTPVYAKDILKDIVECSGNVTVTFSIQEQMSEALEEKNEKFTVGNVVCNNPAVLYKIAGEYDNVIKVMDNSGNSAEATVHITVEDMPVLEDEKEIAVVAPQKKKTGDTTHSKKKDAKAATEGTKEPESVNALAGTSAEGNTNSGNSQSSWNAGNDGAVGSSGSSGNNQDAGSTGNGSTSADMTLENSEETKETGNAQSAESTEASGNTGGVVGNTVDDLGNPGFEVPGWEEEYKTEVTPSGYWTIDEEGNQIFVPDN